MTTYLLNNELNGVEIYFQGKPEKNILTNLKENGYRWNSKKICWYAKQSPKTLSLAEILTNGNITETTQEQPKTKTNKKVLSLYDRLQFKQGNTNKENYRYKFVGSNYDEVAKLPIKEITKLTRQHLKKQFPEVKFSITTDGRGYTDKINVSIKESPYNNNKLEYSPELSRQDYINFEKENNAELLAIKEYCQKLLDSYNFDDSDSMTDYFHVNFYDNVSIDYEYKQTEQTEEVKQDITAFRNQLIEDAKAEEERKHQEYQEYLKQQEEREKQYKIRQEEEKKEIEYINNNVEVKELTEQEQYFIIGSQFAHLNKNQRLETYIEEVEEGAYSLENVKVTREVYFKDKKALEYFSNHLLTDFDFITGTGGSYTEDKRINSMLDFDNMTPEERETVKWNISGLAVYFNNQLQFIVDSSGHHYARYVGLVDNVKIEKVYTWDQVLTDEEAEELKAEADTITDISFNVIVENNIVDTWENENWKLYKDIMKEQFKANNIKPTKGIIQQITEDNTKLKYAMYKLIKEVDTMQEQFKNANLQQGQKITVFKISDFGMMTTSHITVDKVDPSTYAQYRDVIKLTFAPKGKKGLYYSHYYNDLLIYDGWVELPKSVLFETSRQNGFIIEKGLFSNCDRGQYDAIIEHFERQGQRPIINTHKPLF